MLPTTVPTLGSSVFKNCHSSLTIKVPCASVSNYQTSWSGYAQRIVGDSEAMLASVIAVANHADGGTVTKSVTGCSVTLTATPVDSMYRFVRWSDGNTDNPRTVTASGTYTAEFESCLNIVNNVLRGWNSNWQEALPTSITIPEGVTSIYSSAFNGCTNLQSVTFPASIKSMGLSVFKGCTNLSSVNVAEGCQLTMYPDRTFEGCTSLSSITIPASVTSIGIQAFKDCSSLSSITIPALVTVIGNEAFLNCSNLQTVTMLPTTAPTLGSSVFYNCHSNLTIKVPCASVGDYKAANNWSTWQSKIVGDSEAMLASVIAAPNNADWGTVTKSVSGCSVTLMATPASNMCRFVRWSDNETANPRTVTVSGTYTAEFESCLNIVNNVLMGWNSNWQEAQRPTSITIPASVMSIGQRAFKDCSSLSSITIPASVTTIGNYVFFGCSNLSSVTFDDDSRLESIGQGAFWGCDRLSSITIPALVETIGNEAFRGCDRLSSVTIPASVTVIDTSAFYHCDSLSSVTFADNSRLGTIGQGAFNECLRLSSITIPASVTTIGESAFWHCSNLSSVTFADNSRLGTIGQEAFWNCSNLSSITIPASVTSIGANAFNACDSLSSVTFAGGSRLGTIGESAFMNCESLSSITIPASVTVIGQGAFNGCDTLQTVTMLRTAAPTLGDDVFGNCHNNLTIKVPCESVSNYQNNWSTWQSKIVGDSEAMLASVNVEANNADWGTVTKTITDCSITLTATPVDSMYRFVHWRGGNTDNPRTVTTSGTYIAEFEYFLNIDEQNRLTGHKNWPTAECPTSIIIPASVTEIGQNAFIGCTSLSSITIPASVSTIGTNAFQDCTNLSSVTFADDCQLGSIQNHTFDNCKKLSSITIPASVFEIGEKAFRDCTSLQTVTIADGSYLQSIGYEAFSGCKNLSSITIPAMVTVIGRDAFYNCRSLSSVTFDDDCELESISQSAFYNCDSLSSIIIPASVTTIGQSAFNGCSKLSSITIPASVATIGYNAFRNCTSLSSVTMLRTEVPDMGSGVFDNCHNNLTIKVPCESVSNYQNSWSGYAQIIVGDSEAMLASVNVEANNADWGTVTKSVNNCEVTLTATPASGYMFSHWINPDGSITHADATLYPANPTTEGQYTAVFKEEMSSSTSLCFMAQLPNSTVQLKANGTPTAITFETSTDGNTWTEYILGTDITLRNIGDMVYFRNSAATAATTFSTSLSNYYQFVMSGKIAASGNVMSLMDKSLQKTDLTGADYAFYGLFYGCSSLTTAPALPATTLAYRCYQYMFQGCSSLTTAPALPATTLAKMCYNDMFFGCHSLTTAPELPATTLAGGCYQYMFQNCSSLATSPALPATTLEQHCYENMFFGCSSLKSAPALPATTLAENCYQFMFSGCSSLMSAPALPATTLAEYCYDNMFDGCSSLTMSNHPSASGYEWTIPAGADATNMSYWNNEAFKYTGGTFTGAPYIGTTYYTDHAPVTPGIKLNSAGYATYSAFFNAHIVSAGVAAYKAEVNGTTITLTRLEGDIPAGTGVLLYGENKGGTNVEITTHNTSDAMATVSTGTNHLKPSTLANGLLATMPTGMVVYVLDPASGNVFRRYSGSAFIHNRAYFEFDSDPLAGAPMRIVFAEDIATGAESVEATGESAVKLLENGHIVILKNGVRYSVTGQRIK